MSEQEDYTRAGGMAAHKTTHQDGGSDEISVEALSGRLTDDQHVLDAEVKLIKLDGFATPDDNTLLNASTSRHGLLRKLSNVATQYLNGQGAFTTPPDTLPLSAYNLIKNGSFEDSSLPISNIPSGWSLLGTPTCDVETSKIADGFGVRSIKITAVSAANEGLKQTLSDLKPSTQYTIIWWAAAATGGDIARLFTTGATINADIEITDLSMSKNSISFTTDASATNVILNIVAKADTDIAYFDNILVKEGLNLNTIFSPNTADLHLKATSFQSIAPANFSYSQLRMETGLTSKAAPAAVSDNITVTYSISFSKILCFFCCLTSINENSGVSRINVSAYGLSTTQAIITYETNDGGDLSSDADPIVVSWVAIGI